MPTYDDCTPTVGSDDFLNELSRLVSGAPGLTITFTPEQAWVIAFALRETGLRRIIGDDPSVLPEGVAHAAWMLLHFLALAVGMPHRTAPTPAPVVPEPRTCSLQLTSTHAVVRADGVEASGTATDRHTQETIVYRLSVPATVADPLGSACRYFTDQGG